MSRKTRFAGFLSLVLCASSLPLVTTGCAPQMMAPASAQDADVNTVTVIGSGEVSQKPDIARASMGIEVTAPTVAEATRSAAQKMADLIAALKKTGLADKDIQTSNYSINFERAYLPYGPPAYGSAEAAPAPASAPVPAKASAGSKKATAAATPAPPVAAVGMVSPPVEPAGFYRVSNTVTLTIRDITKVGAVLDGAVAAGSNNVWGVTFGLDKPEALEPEARAKAVADAKARAEALAKLAGRSLGDVVSVSEAIRGGNFPMFAVPSAKDAFGGTPIEAGQVSVSAQVEMVYRFAPLPQPQ